MKRLLLVLTILLTTALHAQVSPAYSARLQAVLDSMCNAYHVKGASAAVIVPGIGQWKGVHGESYAGNPITSDMLFGLGSNTKTYIAALMLKLQEEGSLSLDDTIGKWIHNQKNISGQITVRQLLNHTSGIYSYTDSSAFVDSIIADFSRIWSPNEMLQFVGPPMFTAGTGWSYSNTNYLLAGMIASQITGKPVQQALREKILNPQGFSNTWFYPLEQPVTGSMPHVWFLDNGQLLDGNITYGYQHESFLSAANSAGALIATATDNASFWQKMISGQILNSTSMAQWRQIVRLNSSVGYGLGVFRYSSINGHVIYEHGGTGFGFINENLADSVTGVTISLLTNQDSAENDMLFNIVVAMQKITINPPTAITAVPTSISNLSLYPNPAAHTLQLAWNNQTNSILPYIISDITGRTMQSGTLHDNRSSIDISSFPDGAYLLQLGGTSKAFTVLH